MLAVDCSFCSDEFKKIHLTLYTLTLIGKKLTRKTLSLVKDFHGLSEQVHMNKSELKAHLYECLHCEVMKSKKKFSWWRTMQRAIKCPERRYLFWWRIASYLYHSNNKFRVKLAKRINRNLISQYGTEIELGAQIGAGMTFAHYQGIVISQHSIIGRNLHIRQNVTIGAKTGTGVCTINLGDNVRIGANSCIINDNIKIGSNVDIGAMTYINKDIPDNCIIYTQKTNSLVIKNQ